MGGRDCNNTDDDNDNIHSFPQSWRVPRKRKSRSIPNGGRDCNLNNDCDYYDDNEEPLSFPSPMEVPKKRKPGRSPKGGRDCYDPSEGEIYPMRGKDNSNYIEQKTDSHS